MADLDGDGIDDVISGSYPGDLTFYKGLDRGPVGSVDTAKYGHQDVRVVGPFQHRFAKGEVLKRKDGSILNGSIVAENSPVDTTRDQGAVKSEGLAATPTVVDFDGDGDLDLIVGNIAGHVMVIDNEGGRNSPVFGGAKWIEAGGSPIKVSGDAGPTVADWDNDGVWDLLVGGAMGEIMFYRNIGSATSPRFAVGDTLVGSLGDSAYKGEGVPKRSQYRVKVTCVDWNGDGQLDLLAGDVWDGQTPISLTPKQVAAKDSLNAAVRAIDAKLEPYWAKADSTRTEAEKRELRELLKERDRISEEARQFEGPYYATGWVWVYLRETSP